MNRNGKSDLVYVWNEIDSDINFLHTTGLLRHQGSHEKFKNATKFFKGHSKDHSAFHQKLL